MPQEVATDLERQLALALRELSEARDQQAATSDVLRIISSSPGELNPVFQAILAKSRYDIFRRAGTVCVAAGVLERPSDQVLGDHRLT